MGCLYLQLHVPDYVAGFQLGRVHLPEALCHRRIMDLYNWYYLPTPPLGQDMTQGQFLSGV